MQSKYGIKKCAFFFFLFLLLSAHGEPFSFSVYFLSCLWCSELSIVQASSSVERIGLLFKKYC